MTSLYETFYGATSFTGDGLSNWDTSRAGDLAATFYGATSFNGDLSNWVTSSVTTLHVSEVRPRSTQISQIGTSRMSWDWDIHFSTPRPLENCIKRRIYDSWNLDGDIMDDQYSSWATLTCLTTCLENYHVFNNVCVECAEGTTRSGGDPIDGPNTFCAESSKNNNSLIMISVAVTIAMLCVLVIVFFFVRRYRKKQENKLKREKHSLQIFRLRRTNSRLRKRNSRKIINASQRVGFFNGKT